jgi:prepilin-type N-terminal cleavage/methylation domain-containing protein
MRRMHRHIRARWSGRVAVGRAGFSLVEVLITLAIIAIVAGFAIPKIDFTKYRSDAAVRVVRSAIQQAQRLAIQRQFDVIVSFDTANHRVKVIEDKNNDGVVASDERVTMRPIEEGAVFGVPPSAVTGGSSAAIAGSGVRTVGGLPSLIFHRDGAASGDLQVYITSKRQLPRDFRGLVITQATGRVDWYRYVGSSWKSGGI